LCEPSCPVINEQNSIEEGVVDDSEEEEEEVEDEEDEEEEEEKQAASKARPKANFRTSQNLLPYPS
jgi:hypothetical protein